MCATLKSLVKKVGIKSSTNKRLGLWRKKIWDLEHRFHCSVAGTCFTLVEMRRFCRKAQVSIKGLVSDYELHTNFVAILGDAHAARPAAKHLDRKYKATIQHFDQAENSGHLQSLWNEAVSQGEIAAAFWSILTHPQASETLLFQVFGEVHMLSHLSGASVRIDMQALTQLRQRLPKLEKEIAQSRTALLSRTRQKGEVIDKLNKHLNKALQNEKRHQEAEEKIKSLESEEMLCQLRSQVEAYASKLESANVRAKRAEVNAERQKTLTESCLAKNVHIENQLLALSAEQRALEIALEGALSAQHGSCEKRRRCAPKW